MAVDEKTIDADPKRYFVKEMIHELV